MYVCMSACICRLCVCVGVLGYGGSSRSLARSLCLSLCLSPSLPLSLSLSPFLSLRLLSMMAFLALAEPSSATEESRALREVVTEVLTNHCAWPRNGKKYAS